MGISLLSRYDLFLLFLLDTRAKSLHYFQISEILSFFKSSYCGAQIFEIYGLGKEIVDLAFYGSVSRAGGLTLDEVKST